MEGVWGIYVGYRWALYHKRVKHIVCVPKNQNWSKNMENPKIVENVNFIFLKFMTFWKKFYQYFPYFGQLWRNELLLTKIGPVPTNLLTKSENVRVWKLFFIKIYHQKINSRGQQDQNGVYWALSQLTQRTTGLMKSWPPHNAFISNHSLMVPSSSLSNEVQWVCFCPISIYSKSDIYFCNCRWRKVFSLDI